jgi:hypothetical protein
MKDEQSGSQVALLTNFPILNNTYHGERWSERFDDKPTFIDDKPTLECPGSSM